MADERAPKINESTFLEALPHLAKGDRNAFTSELIRGIVASFAGDIAGRAAGNAVQAALEGKFDSPSDKMFRRALAVLEEEQAQNESLDRVAGRLRDELGNELSDILAQLVRVQIGTQGEVLQKLEHIRREIADAAAPRIDGEKLRAAYGALDRRLEKYGLAAKDFSDRYEYDAKLLLDGVAGADEELAVAVLKYNEAYEDLRVNQHAYLDSVQVHLLPQARATGLLSLVFATLLDDVHRRGFLALNRHRAEILDFVAHRSGAQTPGARAQAAEAKLGIMERLRASLKEVNDSVEGLDRRLEQLRAAIREEASP